MWNGADELLITWDQPVTVDSGTVDATLWIVSDPLLITKTTGLSVTNGNADELDIIAGGLTAIPADTNTWSFFGPDPAVTYAGGWPLPAYIDQPWTL